MIVLYLLYTEDPHHVHNSTPQGTIMNLKYAKTNQQALRAIERWLNETAHSDQYHFGGTLVNLETGEIIQERSQYKIPEWARNPFLCALAAANFKAEEGIK